MHDDLFAEEDIVFFEGEDVAFFADLDVWATPLRSQALRVRGEIPERKKSILLETCLVPIAASESTREVIADRVRRAVLNLHDCVEVRKSKCSGVPVLRGTRFTVSQVLGELAEGESIESIADQFELDRTQMSVLLHSMALILDVAQANDRSAIGQE